MTLRLAIKMKKLNFNYRHELSSVLYKNNNKKYIET